MTAPSPASIERFMASGPLLFDIETTGLKADYGLILVIGLMRHHPKNYYHPTQLVLDTKQKDWEKAERKMLKDFLKFVEGETCFITYNGIRFDMPFLQARLAIQGLPLMPKVRHLDMYYTVKRAFGYTVTSRRAKYLQALYRVGDPDAPFKESSEVMTWLRATFSRNQEAFRKIMRHNMYECLPSLDYQVRKLRNVLPRTVALR